MQSDITDPVLIEIIDSMRRVYDLFKNIANRNTKRQNKVIIHADRNDETRTYAFALPSKYYNLIIKSIGDTKFRITYSNFIPGRINIKYSVDCKLFPSYLINQTEQGTSAARKKISICIDHNNIYFINDFDSTLCLKNSHGYLIITESIAEILSEILASAYEFYVERMK